MPLSDDPADLAVSRHITVDQTETADRRIVRLAGLSEQADARLVGPVNGQAGNPMISAIENTGEILDRFPITACRHRNVTRKLHRQAGKTIAAVDLFRKEEQVVEGADFIRVFTGTQTGQTGYVNRESPALRRKRGDGPFAVMPGIRLERFRARQQPF